MYPDPEADRRIELVRHAENLELHHAKRDGDWMRPEDLRHLLRLMIEIIIGKEMSD